MKLLVFQHTVNIAVAAKRWALLIPWHRKGSILPPPFFDDLMPSSDSLTWLVWYICLQNRTHLYLFWKNLFSELMSSSVHTCVFLLCTVSIFKEFLLPLVYCSVICMYMCLNQIQQNAKHLPHSAYVKSCQTVISLELCQSVVELYQSCTVTMQYSTHLLVLCKQALFFAWECKRLLILYESVFRCFQWCPVSVPYYYHQCLSQLFNINVLTYNYGFIYLWFWIYLLKNGDGIIEVCVNSESYSEYTLSAKNVQYALAVVFEIMWQGRVYSQNDGWPLPVLCIGTSKHDKKLSKN